MQTPSEKSGLRIHRRKGHPEVCNALIRFAKWLRTVKKFPVRVNVYLSHLERVRAKDGDQCTGLIWIPDEPNYYPHIRLATGDYELLKKEKGRDNALASYLASLAHELIHYGQWLEYNDMWERGVNRKASTLVNRYAQTTDHP